MLICLKTCNKTLSISQLKLLRNSTSKKILQPSLRRNSTRSTTQHGIVSWEETSVHTLPTRPSILFTSISDRLPSFSLNQAERARGLQALWEAEMICYQTYRSISNHVSNQVCSYRRLSQKSLPSHRWSSIPFFVLLLAFAPRVCSFNSSLLKQISV